MSNGTASFGGKLVTYIPKPNGRKQRKYPICFNDWIFYKLVADTGCYLLSSLPYELKTDVSFDEYIFRTDKHNVKGLWEWENGTVRVLEIPSKFHEVCVGTINGELYSALRLVKNTPSGFLFPGATSECLVGFLYVLYFGYVSITHHL